MFFLSYVCYAFVQVCLFVPCGHLLGKGRPLQTWLSFMVYICEFVTFPLVSWVKVVNDCIAPLLTFSQRGPYDNKPFIPFLCFVFINLHLLLKVGLLFM